MCLLDSTFYELGQYLQILLWISLPMVILVLLITTWLHYRKKTKSRREKEYVSGDPYIAGDLYIAGNPSIAGDPFNDRTASPEPPSLPSEATPQEESPNTYQGFLWMKDKYEQYVELSDKKYYKLKEQLTLSENKYLELLTVKDGQRSDPSSVQQQLEERESVILQLNEQLALQTGKVTDLTGKLENNVRLLLHIHQELDRSLSVGNGIPATTSALPTGEHAQDKGPSSSDEKRPLPVDPSLKEDTKIVAWLESEGNEDLLVAL